MIKYLKTLGFDVTNDIFAENSWYFRNALVRANYNNLRKNIHATTEFLELFFRNLILNEANILQNRRMHIKTIFLNDKESDIEREKPDIENVYIQSLKIAGLSSIVQRHVLTMYKIFGRGQSFGRSDVVNLLNLKPSRTSDLLKESRETGVIIPVKGYGKGKYTF